MLSCDSSYMTIAAALLELAYEVRRTMKFRIIFLTKCSEACLNEVELYMEILLLTPYIEFFADDSIHSNLAVDTAHQNFAIVTHQLKKDLGPVVQN